MKHEDIYVNIAQQVILTWFKVTKSMQVLIGVDQILKRFSYTDFAKIYLFI